MIYIVREPVEALLTTTTTATMFAYNIGVVQ
jgi:hypothetical protein